MDVVSVTAWVFNRDVIAPSEFLVASTRAECWTAISRAPVAIHAARVPNH